MKSFSLIETLRMISKKLHEKNIFRKIGITYQVFWNLFLISLLAVCMSVFFVGGTAAGYFASLVMDESLRSEVDMRTQIYDYEETSQVYFANDVFLGTLPSEIEREKVALKDVSQHVKNAIIATEDAYFYEHDGIVPKAILRATFQEFSNSSTQTGGSTLTQQLIKNQILTSEVSFDRKATEILLAMRLEKFLEKDEILEAYLNIVPFGRNSSGRKIAGVQAAAQGIFGVDAKDLSLAQAAYIAGLPQSPFGYTPFTGDGSVKENLEPSLTRMKTVLSRMHEAGFISQKELDEALTYDVRSNLTTSTPAPIDEYPYLTFEIMRRATDVLLEKKIKEQGIVLDELDDEERLATINKLRDEATVELRNGGYHIHTTVDKDIYIAMQEAVKTDHLFGPVKNGEQEEVGAVLIENKTGAIKGFVGGRDEGGENHYNHATQAYRPNASTMKPLLAYAPAMEIGAIQPAIVVPDTPAFYANGKEIKNFDHGHQGLISIRESLARSRNVPAVRSFKQVPHELARETLLNLGFKLKPGEPYESAALGATEYNVTVEQNTSAFTTFANLGTRRESYMIDRIETSDGKIVYEHEPVEHQVFTPQTAYLTIDMLRDVLRPGGTASSLRGRLAFSADWAGKTGTSSDTKDSWFVGFNPNVTLGVWIGYDTPKEIQRTVGGLRYGPRTQQIWANIANSAYKINPELMKPNERFKMPEGIVSRSVCSLTGLLPSKACQEAGLVKTDLFNAKFLPSKTDNSLESGRYVTINGSNYLALSSTPNEFTKVGFAVSNSIWDIADIGQYLPDSLKNIIPNRPAPNNGQTPGPVTGVSLNGSTLSWNKHPDNDIVGYRIYRAAQGQTSYQYVTSVVENITTSTTVQSGYSYYVTAVDTAGRESSASGFTEATPPPEVEEPNDEKDAEEPSSPPPATNGNGQPSDHGSNSGNGNSGANGNNSNNGNGSNGNSDNNGPSNGNNGNNGTEPPAESEQEEV